VTKTARSHRHKLAAALLGLAALAAACSLSEDGLIDKIIEVEKEVEVEVPPPAYALGGTVSGLTGELTLVGAGSELTLTDNGDFTFPDELYDGTPYHVAVVAQPAGQHCAVENGSGTIDGQDVDDVTVTCGDEPGLFSIGGTVAGLAGVLVLANGAEEVTLTGNGSFTFPTAVPDGTSYDVQIVSKPPDQVCEVQQGAGVVAGADVTDVAVTCVSDDASLADLTVTPGTLSPAFSPATTSYTVDVPLFVQAVTITPTVADPAATVQVDGTIVDSGSPSEPLPLNLGANVFPVTVIAESGTIEDYTVVVTRAADVAYDYLKASNTGTNDYFGYAIALSGDTLAVGAYGEDSSATGVNGNQDGAGNANDSGAVYVFVRFDDGSGAEVWAQQAYIKASNTGGGDQFGYALALDGDTLAVGAWHEDSSATGIDGLQDGGANDSGAVYVFTRNAASLWSQQAYIKASNTAQDDIFGSVAVGAYGEDSNATDIGGNQADNSASASGAVYVFTRSGGSWSQEEYIKASDVDQDDNFGFAVALSGDTLAVGARTEDSSATGIDGDDSDNSATDSGAAYVFVRAGGVWTQQAYIKSSTTGGGDRFGKALALDGNTLAVGAYLEDSSAEGVNGNETLNDALDSGAVYVFTRDSNGDWTQQAYIKASNTDAGDVFGYSVAIHGDVLAVGAPFEDSAASGLNGAQSSNGATDAGAVYLFSRQAGTWTQLAYLKATNTDQDDWFGIGISLWGDTLAVGADHEDSAALGINGDQFSDSVSASGAAYVIR